uniref:Uncharacterized protein n=1 Tax=Cucumis melo TaxID=3656 RepID=A0A9I9D6N1_CUCME
MLVVVLVYVFKSSLLHTLQSKASISTCHMLFKMPRLIPVRVEHVNMWEETCLRMFQMEMLFS